MNGIEHGIARDVRRQLEKRSVDSSVAVVTVSKGVVYVSGTIKPLRSQPLADVHEEMDFFRRQVLRMGREVKNIILECRIIGQPKKEHHVDGPSHTSGPAAPGAGATGGDSHHLPEQHV